MKHVRCIINKIKKLNQELDNKNGMSWMEYRKQWLLENNTWSCKENRSN